MPEPLVTWLGNKHCILFKRLLRIYDELITRKTTIASEYNIICCTKNLNMSLNYSWENCPKFIQILSVVICWQCAYWYLLLSQSIQGNWRGTNRGNTCIFIALWNHLTLMPMLKTTCRLKLVKQLKLKVYLSHRCKVASYWSMHS